jgi:hypothetical protein
LILIIVLSTSIIVGLSYSAQADIGDASGPKGRKYYLVASKIADILSDKRYLDPPIHVRRA